jgi:tetratricopeptide (TPR) repeat protein
MDWIKLLRSQQADFIQRLKSGCLLHCEIEGQHSELTVISGERLKQLRDFCWQMAEKYKRTSPSPVRDVFINNLKGKLGEEVIKARLDKFVTEVDYEKRLSGDGKIDFTLTSNSSVGIQVKARHGNSDTIQWSITSEEVEKNAVLVCILIQEEVSEAQSEYNLIMAGFMPTKLIELSNGKASLAIDKLLYPGGLRSYLENLDSSEDSDSFLALTKIYQESAQSPNENQDTHIALESISKAYAYHSIGIDRYSEGNYERAIEDFNESIRLNPKMSITYSIRGLTRTKIKDYQGAIEDYTQALKILAEDAATLYYNLGESHHALRDKKRAIESLQKASELYKKQEYQGKYRKVINKIKNLQGNVEIHPWQVGDCIIHEKMGTGQVTKIFGEGNRTTLAIRFGIVTKIIDSKSSQLQRME